MRQSSYVIFRRIFASIIPLIIVVAGYSFAIAQVSYQVTVTATVPEKPPIEEPDTTVVFSGIAYPRSTITITQDGTPISIITANSQARFEVSVIVDPGTYTFSVYGTDVNGTRGRVSNFTLLLSKGSTTTISGIFLGPTITRTPPSIGPGETVTLSGTTAPESTVNVTLTSPQVGAGAGSNPTKIAVHIASSDTNGRWLQLFNADDLVEGTHSAKAQATEPISQAVSEFSDTVSFDVTGTGEPDVCAGAVPGDINCDGAVNLIDFSIMLFYWNASNPSNARADINQDGTVDIIDFSIMLYYWTG
ncbi:MAG: dockerin type I domain-containing protein [Patescibacteria group bacterium]|nr:dockerin type I domain-containing protein [Patescibacteria group bacterium]MDD5715841.1 dockerin type I domain-containing protein [Patescibacteria group bacterium]